MRLVVSLFISLDGVAQAPGGAEEDTEGGFGHGGWSMPFFDPETMGAAVGRAMETTDALLFGRRTWEVMAAAWPERAGDPFADRMNDIEKFVVSRTLGPADLGWANSHLLPAGDQLTGVRQVLARPGRDLQVMGSLSVVRALVAADLVDELRLMIEPVLLGGGKRPFPDDGALRRFELAEAVTAATGVQICTYRRPPAP